MLSACTPDGAREASRLWKAAGCLLFCLLLLPCSAQDIVEPARPPAAQDEQLNVNWLYGAYVPKEAPLLPLTGRQRLKLYERQSFITPGIYLKTALFSITDQVTNSPPGWGDGFQAYGYRVASRHGQFVIQNTISALGNAVLQYEPRYDRCRCSGLWPRTGHALLRNFVTYNNTETELRPQFALYGAALTAGMISNTWKPRRDIWGDGYRSMMTQAAFGVLSNWIGEFAPEIVRVLRRNSATARK